MKRTSYLMARLLILSLFAWPVAPVLATDEKVPRVRKAPEPEMQRQALKYPDAFYIEGMGYTKQVALTFDDGPGEYTSELLEVLNKHKVKGTFFWEGRRMLAHSDVVRSAAAQGHALGNHSFSHPHSRELGAEALWNTEVGVTQAVFQYILGYEPALYRPPYGEITDAQIDLLRDKGLFVIGWSIDPKDWSMTKPGAAPAIIEVVQDYVHPEAIVLLHEGIFGYPPNTIEAVDTLIPELQKQGYEFVSVDQLLHVPGALPRHKPLPTSAQE